MGSDVLLVTLYNQRVYESKTISSFVANCFLYHSRVHLYIWDNSTDIDVRVENSKTDFGDIKFTYYQSKENTPLSIVYNTVIDRCNQSQVLFNFDQDSLIEESYFKVFYDTIKTYPTVGLFCPIIYYGNRCVSPGRMGYFKNYYFESLSPGLVSSKGIMAITSGIALNLSLIREYSIRYDENLNLYGVDMKFCIDYSQKQDSIVIMNYCLKHDLSCFDKSERANTKLFRLKNSFRADLYISKKRGHGLLRSIYLVVRYIYHYIYLFLNRDY